MLFNELTRCRAWIEAALKYTDGTHSFDDIAAGCFVGRFTLLPKQNSCAVLEIQAFPQKRALNVFLVGGDLQEIIAAIGETEEMAREAGASEITMTGRFGWERVLAPRGWDRAHVTMKKVL